jgi:DNA-binding NtrC family response regulator
MTPAARILIVDDEVAVVELLRDCFLRAGYRVDTALHAGDALTLIEHDPPSLVLLDLAMPGMDGIQVLARIRATHPETPVIMVTANADVAVARQALTMGAFEYVTKPFDLEYLERVVSLAVNTARPAPSGC